MLNQTDQTQFEKPKSKKITPTMIETFPSISPEKSTASVTPLKQNIFIFETKREEPAPRCSTKEVV